VARVRALRGICVGVERHLVPGEVADVDGQQVPFLASIGAVELVIDEPAAVEPAPEVESSAKPGKKEK
jgi:hypothetical protein